MRWQSAGGLFMVTLAWVLACGSPESGLFDDSPPAAGGGSPDEPGDAGEGGGKGEGGETGDAGEAGSGTGGTGAVGAGGTTTAGQGTGGTGAGGSNVGGNGTGGSNIGGDGAGGSSIGGTVGSGGTVTGGTGGSSGSSGSGGTSSKVCPDVLGKYEIDDVDGNCANLESNVTQSIDATADPCIVHFASDGALNGSAPLEEDGDFTGATLAVGNSVRSDCNGEWSDGAERMTVTCGTNINRCIVRLDRL